MNIQQFSIDHLLNKWGSRITSSHVFEYMMTIYERRCLAALALEHQKSGQAIFEFGTFMGITTAFLANTLPDVTTYSLDKPVGKGFDSTNATRDTFGSECKSHKNVRLLEGDSMNYPITNHVPYKCFLVLVDGCHDYEYVKNDYELALQIVGGGGIIILHNYDDINVDGPTEFVHSTNLDDWQAIEKTNFIFRQVQ